MLLGTTNLLGAVFLFLALLTAGLLDFNQLVALKTVLGFESHGSFEGIVDESETGALVTTESSLDTENKDGFRVNLVHLAELGTDVNLAAVGDAGMDNVDNHLLAEHETVGHELASAQSNRRSFSLN